MRGIQRTDEAGFTLAELMVVLVLLGVIIAAVFAGLQVAQGGANIAMRESRLQSEIGSPLHIMDKLLSQNQAVESGDGYTLVFRTPTDVFTRTFHRYVVAADGAGRLTEAEYVVDAVTGVSTPVNSAVWSDSNVNRALSKPMFTYLDESGLTTTTVVASRSISMEIWARHDGRTISGKRHIYFRNR